MRHLLICREYPPAPGGGIGTYAFHVSRLLAEMGEVVFVVAAGDGFREASVETSHEGRLVVHRLPFDRFHAVAPWLPLPAPLGNTERALYASDFFPQSFAWQAALLAERLIESEAIDLVEGQEYEAPLYYLQLRRSLGLGPQRCPPIVVHLHSPTPSIVRHNGWQAGHPHFVSARRLERHSIAAADALLCPSRFLAAQVEQEHAQPVGTVHVIPYPTGSMKFCARKQATWRTGSVLYVGRMEGRKGVIEWVDAIVQVARTAPDQRFVFVGANILGTTSRQGKALLQQRIPDAIRHQFVFAGHQDRASLGRLVAEARIAVVPSRWDNFPNTCVEAMASGLPVLATRQGGMAEMVRDGVTGWLSDDPGPAQLANALRRALATPPLELEAMGLRAAEEIGAFCENGRIMAAQLAFRERVVAEGAQRSMRLPKNQERPARAPAVPRNGTKAAAEPDEAAAGIAVIVRPISSATREQRQRSLASLARQERRPPAVIIGGVVHTGPVDVSHLSHSLGTQKVTAAGRPDSAVDPLAALFHLSPRPLGAMWLRAGQTLSEAMLARAEATLRRCPEVGIVSFWTRATAGSYALNVEPCPSLPDAYFAPVASTASVFRLSALSAQSVQVAQTTAATPEAFALFHWELVAEVLHRGLVGVTVPEVLCEAIAGLDVPTAAGAQATRARLRARFLPLAELPDELAEREEFEQRSPLRVGGLSAVERYFLAKTALSDPRPRLYALLSRGRARAGFRRSTKP